MPSKKQQQPQTQQQVLFLHLVNDTNTKYYYLDQNLRAAIALLLHNNNIYSNNNNGHKLQKKQDGVFHANVGVTHLLSRRSNENENRIGRRGDQIMNNNKQSKKKQIIEFQNEMESLVNYYHGDVVDYSLEMDDLKELEYSRQFCRMLQQLHNALDWHDSMDLSDEKKTYKRLIYIFLPGVGDEEENIHNSNRWKDGKLIIEMLTKLRQQWLSHESDETSVEIHLSVIDTSSMEQIVCIGMGNEADAETQASMLKQIEIGKEIVIDESNFIVDSTSEDTSILHLLKSTNIAQDQKNIVEALPYRCFVRHEPRIEMENTEETKKNTQLPSVLHHCCLLPTNKFDGKISERSSYLLHFTADRCSPQVRYDVKFLSMLMEGSNSALVLKEERQQRYFYVIPSTVDKCNLVLNEMTFTDLQMMQNLYPNGDHFVPFELLLSPSIDYATCSSTDFVKLRNQSDTTHASTTLDHFKSSQQVYRNRPNISCISDFKAAFDACIYKGYPLPKQFVNDLFPAIFLKLFTKVVSIFWV